MDEKFQVQVAQIPGNGVKMALLTLGSTVLDAFKATGDANLAKVGDKDTVCVNGVAAKLTDTVFPGVIVTVIGAIKGN